MQWQVYFDNLKPGETREGGPWCYTVSHNGHVYQTRTGFYNEQEAEDEARAVAGVS